MSELEKHTKFAHYDALPTEKLQEILRKHAHGQLHTEPDTEELYCIMEVLAQRRGQQSQQEFRSNEEALAELREHYLPQTAKKTPAAAYWLQCAAAIAVVVVTLFVAFSGTAASGTDMRGGLAIWTEDILWFEDALHGSVPAQNGGPLAETHPEPATLQEALDQNNISYNLVPTWLPEGYVLTDVNVGYTPKEVQFDAGYTNGEYELIIYIDWMLEYVKHNIMKDDKPVEMYSVNGVDYYIFTNGKYIAATWMVGDCLCSIVGQITREELKQMLDSI